MPTRGDLHRQAHYIANPFDEEPPRIQEYTAKEIAILQSRLDKQLGPEYISTRKGPGGQNVHYLGAEKIINLANEVFGFNGWSTSIRDTTIDYVDIEKDGRVSMGLSIIMRVTLRDGTYHEDIGYGTISNCSGKGAAFEKTKKEAATDAMKRALRNFGNVLGNCLYDKEYLKKVVKIKPPPSRWTEEKLHRHPDVVGQKAPNEESPVEKEVSIPPTRTLSELSKASTATDYDDEFGGNAFDDVDFTRSDEFIVPDNEMVEDQHNTIKQEMNSTTTRLPVQQAQSVPQQPKQQPNVTTRPQPKPQQQHQPTAPTMTGQSNVGSIRGGQTGQQNRISEPNRQQSTSIHHRATSCTPESIQQRPPAQGPQGASSGEQQMPGPPVGFVRGRVAEMVQNSNGQLPANSAFNPHAESPSIRKTNGVNHRTSAPIRKDEVGVALSSPAPINGPAQGFASSNVNNNINNSVQHPPQGNNMSPLPRPNYVNPQHDPHRKIGVPQQPGLQSPGARPGSYRPPGPAGVKRGPPETISRPPLGDVSNLKVGVPPDGGGTDTDTKRVKTQGQEDSARPVST
ncbi:uncharacterized protein PV09_03669 [Verruconis gallopava]|uniref:RAD52 homolog n=1 Tax=Verruconis gallopava TaxID=253628 RepID=A0A0D2ADP7_9PEZI|nr:uncharacterized protein PV09_03669 [Verruconis gallopava]KIW05113.1 hypothetical protein PV09_03669 [Verruconis gallopava]